MPNRISFNVSHSMYLSWIQQYHNLNTTSSVLNALHEWNFINTNVQLVMSRTLYIIPKPFIYLHVCELNIIHIDPILLVVLPIYPSLPVPLFHISSIYSQTLTLRFFNISDFSSSTLFAFIVPIVLFFCRFSSMFSLLSIIYK